MTLPDPVVRLEKKGESPSSASTIRPSMPPRLRPDRHCGGSGRGRRRSRHPRPGSGRRGENLRRRADIKEFGKPRQPPLLSELCDAIEQSQKPVVAAIHGNALGADWSSRSPLMRELQRVTQASACRKSPWNHSGAGGTQRCHDLSVSCRPWRPSPRAPDDGGRSLAARPYRCHRRRRPRRHGDHPRGAPDRRAFAPHRSLPFPPFDHAAAEAALADIKKKARGQIALGRAAEMVMAGATLSSPKVSRSSGRLFSPLSSASRPPHSGIFSLRTGGAPCERPRRHYARKVETSVSPAAARWDRRSPWLSPMRYKVILVEQNEQAAEGARGRVGSIYERSLNRPHRRRCRRRAQAAHKF